jgi:hypothetical protein
MTLSLPERFMALFEGSDVAHGQTTVGRTKRDGKAEAKSFVVREPLTVERIDSHLRGGQGIGSIPINTSNRCRFGAIDVDDYDLSLPDVVRRVREIKAPLVVCRSKSGGAHLFLFLNRFEEAVLVRDYLTELASALGFAGREIFPKQDTILVDRGDVGNFINLPYHNAESTMRYGLSEQATALSLEEFLDFAEARRCNLADLEHHTLRQQAPGQDLRDYPPCMRRIIANGGFSVNRNISLFHSVVALRKERPDDWKEAVEEFNARFMRPPLPALEVSTIQRQHERKADYGFKCNDSPMRDYCDKELCRQARYGIGGEGGNAFPELTGLTVMLADPRVYYLNVDGKRLELSTSQLNNPREFQLKCLNDLRLRPPVPKEADWNKLVNKLLKESVEVDVPAELTFSGQFLELLEEYCTSRARATGPEEVNLGRPWTHNGYHHFKMAGLEAFLIKRGFTSFNRAQIQEQLRTLTGIEDCNKHLRINAGGKASTVRVWFVPQFESKETFTEEEIHSGSEKDEKAIPF